MREDLTRQSEQTSADPLGTDAVKTIARKIMGIVADPTMHFSIPVRVARAVVERRLPPGELAELLDVIQAKNRAKDLDCPRAYFFVAVTRLFERHEIPWRTPRREPKTDLFDGL